MKIRRKATCLLMLLLFLSFSGTETVLAAGEGNMDGGGGGFGTGTSTNKWVNGDEGVRVTVVRASDGTAVSASVDLTNVNPGNIVLHFAKRSKVAYRGGASLIPNTGTYTYINPGQPLPSVISTSSGGSNIAQIKRYFTDEQIIRGIAGYCGFDFDTLISGDYKLLVEPLAYVTFQGARTAMTATEAAMYDRMLSGLMQSKMPSLSHKNLPLAIFLEKSDLGFPAWTGSKTDRVSNETIISSLGIGIVRFNEIDTSPELESVDYEYRVDTEVITAVTISGGQSDPDHPVNVTFHIDGRSYTVSNVYYPEDASQLAWVRWRTPSTPQIITITVSASGSGSPGQGSITARIVDLDGNDPPNPTANDRNNSYSRSNAEIPENPAKDSAYWSIWAPWWQEHWVWHSDWNWHSQPHSDSCLEGCTTNHGSWVDDGEWVDEGWWEFDLEHYSASMSASMDLSPDDKNPTVDGSTIKSGYGVNVTVHSTTTTNQSSAVTGSQTAVSYFPEFYYRTYWRLLEQVSSGMEAEYQFKSNEYSTYGRRTHFSPIWMPDGSYTAYTYVMDSWTPDGMLSANLTDSVQISGNLWSDWHIAPKK
ncbi:MAG: hypothetical protein J1E98_00580 [Lachnospiraceae bacterium]|nr:hypothetical protein [Lachnospiraceae bacterium]